MKLNKITITGIDNEVDYSFIKDMSDQFPFVEWGVLLSKSRKDTDRYPGIGWISGLMDFFIGPDGERKYRNFSAHICGDLCVDFICKPSRFYQDDFLGGPSLHTIFSRVQLNGYPDRLYSSAMLSGMAADLQFDATLILPLSNARVEEHTMETMVGGTSMLNYLYDRSRGRGIAPSTWPEPLLRDDGYIGYAGGINRDNILDVIGELVAVNGDENFWIDLETGARDENDFFDTNRVEKILTIAQDYIVR